MASAEFDDQIEEKRPTVQVGDPFTEKCLLEACLELMATGAVIAIQDMGAAGLTCSAVEMGASGNLGISLDLDKVPCREEHMSAYEMMLSESQERMLMVLEPSKQAVAEAVFTKWDLDFAVVGETTDDLRFKIHHHGALMADLPIKELGDEAPEYDRPWTMPTPAAPLENIPDLADPMQALKTMLGSPDMASKRWITEQYDCLIQANTAQLPGGDAGVVRVEGTQKALAMTSDVTPRYCEADPFEGGKQAVAETWRNLTAVGATPLAITDNLNFGNPQRPEIMGQFVRAIEGIGEACRILEYPVVSGNVSLYNETNGQGILPTPTIGGVGLMADWTQMARLAFANDGDVIILVGEGGTHLGQSIYLREVHGLETGPAPKVDLAVERRNGDFVRSQILDGCVTACHDISDGGLLVAVAEMAMAGGIGAELADVSPDSAETLFGEDQARYLLTLRPENVAAFLKSAADLDVPATQIGIVGGEELKLGDNHSISVGLLKQIHESWLPGYMSGTKT
jgi:phosphoribosylformylglycinamidine synthase